MKIAFIGPPGVGKGTHAKRLAKQTGRPHISTGDMFREAIAAETHDGHYARAFIDKGELVPCDKVIELVMGRLNQDDCQSGYYLDGFPRTLNQAEAFDAVLKEQGQKLDFAIEFFVEHEEKQLVQRISGRRYCSQCPEWYHLINKPPRKQGACDVCGASLYQRSDDSEETLKKRLTVFHKSAEPMLAYYEAQGVLRRINATNSIEETYKTLLKIIGLL